MKVARTTDAGSLELVEAQEPELEAGEALIELVCCGVCGTDLYKLADRRRPPGEVLGHEVVGRVVASRSDQLRPGDRVAAPHHAPCGDCRLCRSGAETMCPRFAENLLDPGGFSERIRLRARAVTHTVRKLDDRLSDEAAVFLEPSACVLRSIDRAGLGCDTPEVLIIGAGAMGLLHLLILRALFADAHILVVEMDEGRLETARQLGADYALPPEDLLDAAGKLRTTLPANNGKRQDAATTRGAHAASTEAPVGGVDAVFDTAGGQAPLDLALQTVRPGGRVVLFAHAGGNPCVSIDINALFKSERQVVGAYSGSTAEQARALDLLNRAAFDPTPLVTHRLPLARAAEAVDLCRRREALKVLLHP